ncbi:hypothetical protein V8C42DRAFT_337845 [Trichoderma barbatum]
MKSYIATAVFFNLAAITCAYKTIYSGTGFGTYYYDVNQPQSCGTDFALQNGGNVMCSNSALPLTAINSNYLVAMNNSQLAENPDIYCGKAVKVSANGVLLDLPLFIGDGCERCGKGSSSNIEWNWQGAPGLDFSCSVLNMLQADAYNAGHINITWEITDEVLFNFITGW